MRCRGSMPRMHGSPPPSAPPPNRGLGLAAVALASMLVLGVTLWAVQRGIVLSSGQLGFAFAVVIWGLLLAVSLWRGHIGSRLFLGACGLAVPPGLWLADQWGYDVGILAGERGPVAAVFAAVCTLTILGVARRQLWAWWLACAGAVTGALSAGLNGIGSLSSPDFHTWSAGTVFGAVCIALVGLLGRDVRRAFQDGAHTNPVWKTTDPVIVALRWTIGTSLVALPMLLVYAWTQPVVPATATPAIVLAALLAISGVLAIGRKLVGALLLCLSGLGLLALTGATLALADDADARYIACYYAVFWTPAGLLSAWTGGRILGRLGKLLRG